MSGDHKPRKTLLGFMNPKRSSDDDTIVMAKALQRFFDRQLEDPDTYAWVNQCRARHGMEPMSYQSETARIFPGGKDPWTD